MKVILLAAGRSKRLKPIEDKNFLEFLGKPLIVHQLEQLISAGFNDILLIGGIHNLDKLKTVVKMLDSKTRSASTKKLKSTRAELSIRTLEQKNLDHGMAGAVLSAEKFIKKNEPILVVSANDIVDASAYKLILDAAKDQQKNKKFESFLLGKKVSSYFPGGYLKEKNGCITSIVEKPGAGNEPSNIVNLVIHYHRNSKALFKALHAAKTDHDDRYETALDSLIKGGTKMKTVAYPDFWKPIKFPWDVLTVMEHFLTRLEESADSRAKSGQTQTGKVQPGKLQKLGQAQQWLGSAKVDVANSATIKGKVYFEEGVRIMENAVIVGPVFIGKNTVIATNALVRDSQVGANCVIGFGSEVARSYLGNQVWTHTNYIGDSIIGNDNSFGSGTVTGNLRLDEANILVNIQDQKTDSGRTKFGLITGDHLRCGINTSFMPGVKIGHNCLIGAGIIVAHDIPDHQYVYGKTELIMKENRATLDLEKRDKMKKNL